MGICEGGAVVAMGWKMFVEATDSRLDGCWMLIVDSAEIMLVGAEILLVKSGFCSLWPAVSRLV